MNVCVSHLSWSFCAQGPAEFHIDSIYVVPGVGLVVGGVVRRTPGLGNSSKVCCVCTVHAQDQVVYALDSICFWVQTKWASRVPVAGRVPRLFPVHLGFRPCSWLDLQGSSRLWWLRSVYQPILCRELFLFMAECMAGRVGAKFSAMWHFSYMC